MNSSILPAVLVHPRGPLSMERALKQIKEIVEEYNAVSSAGGDDSATDKSQASIDDLDTMLSALSFGPEKSAFVEVTYVMNRVDILAHPEPPRFSVASGSTRMYLTEVPAWIKNRNELLEFPMIIGVRPV